MSINLIIRQVTEALEGDPLYSGKCVFCNQACQDTFISCDPYDLTEALINIVKELLAVRMPDRGAAEGGTAVPAVQKQGVSAEYT